MLVLVLVLVHKAIFRLDWRGTRGEKEGEKEESIGGELARYSIAPTRCDAMGHDAVGKSAPWPHDAGNPG